MRYITIQLCSICLILSTLVMSGKLKTISTRSTRTYKRIIYLIIACLVFDILSIICIMNLDSSYLSIIKLFCKLYLISIILVGMSIFEYLLSDQPTNKVYVFAIRLLLIMYVCIILIYITIQPLEVRFDNEKNILYSDGSAVMCTFVNMAILLFISIIMSHILYKLGKVSIGKAKAVQIWSYILITGGLIQFFNRDLLVIGFFMSLSTIVIFEKRESPNQHTDIETELFNATAFRAHVRESFAVNRTIYCIRLAVNTGRKDLSIEESNNIIKLFSKMLKKCPGIVFKTSSYSFAIISENKISIAMALESITAFINNANSKLIIPGIKCLLYTLKDIKLFSNADEYIDIYYKLKTYKVNTEEYVTTINVDNNVIEKISAAENIRREINLALEENRVEVFYQPIYDTRTNTFCSAEALLRIRKANGTIISPGEIIPVAEESGLIIPLGEKVFSLVCEFLSSNEKPEALSYVEVNLSAIQCKHEMLYKTFTNIMKQYKINQKQINLEITESAKLNTTKNTISIFNSFKKDGVSFSLDDFGTGNSNLDYVANMPMISIIKFDQTMTNSIFTNERAKAIFPHIVSMIKEMNLEIVCEGIETEDRLNVIKDYGIDYIQGYYFSKPLPKDEFIKFMNKYKSGYYIDKQEDQEV